MIVWLERRKGLRRFRQAQDRVWDQVVDELSRGKKETHWMWFVFPQLVGLGRSRKSRIYGLTKGEAKRYWRNQILRDRLLYVTGMVRYYTAFSPNRPSSVKEALEQIFGQDTVKFQSCMNLFYEITQDERFERMLI